MGGRRWGKKEIMYLCYTFTTRMTPALRWAEMRAILRFHYRIVRDKVARQCPQTTAL